MGLLRKASKGLLADAQKLQKMGNGGDSILAHIGPKEAAMLKAAGGAGTINRRTGLIQFEGSDGGDGEGPGGEGDTGASGPGTGADGTGTGVGGVGGPGDTSGLTGHESETAVESGEIPGTPVGTPSDNSVSTAGLMGLLGKWGQPDLGFLGNQLGNQLGHAISNPGQTAINGLIGTIPGLGLANTISGILGGPTVGSVVGSALSGMSSSPDSTGVSAGSPTPGGPGAGNGGAFGDGGGSNFAPATPGAPMTPGSPQGLPPLVPQPYNVINPTNPLFRFGNMRGLLG